MNCERPEKKMKMQSVLEWVDEVMVEHVLEHRVQSESDLQSGRFEELFRAELQSTFAQLKRLNESEHEGSENETIAECSIIRSMKR